VPIKTLANLLSEDGFASESTVHFIVNRLRKKLGDDSYLPRIFFLKLDLGTAIQSG
jgi:hypothetical protein